MRQRGVIMKHILVVDEDRTILEIVKNTLSSTYKVTEMVTGPQVLQFLTTTIPDLILMEVQLTVMDGFELINRIRNNEATKRIPIVCMSKRDVELENRCRTVAADFIIKPFIPSAMLQTINDTIASIDQQRSLGGMMQGNNAEYVDPSQRDVLTGLLDWNAAVQIIDHRLNSNYSGSLFMIDLDNSKAFADVYGSQSSEMVLQMAARTVQENTDSDDVLCRVFGDVFMIFFSGITDRQTLKQKAETLISEFAWKLSEGRFDANTSLSIGIGIAPEDARDFVHLYSMADKALYFVKQSGKGSYHFYSKEGDGGNGNNVDLWSLQTNFSSVIPDKGAYLLDIRGFQYVYNFLHRRAERGSIDARMVLFTLAPDQGYLPKKEELEKAVERLDQALYSTLRRGDVSTQYSGRQVLVILLDITAEACATVVQRVAINYEKMDPQGRIHLLYETVELGADIIAAKAALDATK